MNWKNALVLYSAALWWGSLTALGAWVVPSLFIHAPAPALAGNLAAHLFSAQTWVAAACGLVLLMASRSPADRGQAEALARLVPWVLGGMLLALLSEFAIAPRIVARDNLRLWHSVGTVLFALQWLCAGASLWLLAPRRLTDA